MSDYMNNRKRAAVSKGNDWRNRKRPAVAGGRKFKLRQLQGTYTEYANYNDEIHETIECCPVITEFMNSKQFQRLRKIHQLGTTYLLYGNATHSRFEHSLGVAKLAKDVCEYVSRQQPALEVSDKDILCVNLAGLLHDIGHGLFSHCYEAFRGQIEREIASDDDLKEQYKDFPEVPKGWSHERSSLATIDDVLESLGLQIDMDPDNLDMPLKQIADGLDAKSLRVFKGRTTPNTQDATEDKDVLTNRDFIFIKECIYGKPIPEVVEKYNENKLIGRPQPMKEWLYDVVCNRHNGIDVDKVDYFARDASRARTSSYGQINVRVLREVVVAKAKCNNESNCDRCSSPKGYHYMICYPEKCIKDVRRFFETRFDLHESIYQHKTTTASSRMLVDILKKADLHYLLKGKDGMRYPLSRAVLDPEAFYRLKDDVIIENIAENIFDSDSEQMKEAQVIAKRFLHRDLYKSCGEKVVDLSNEHDKELWDLARKEPEKIEREIYNMEVSSGGPFGLPSKPKHGETTMELDDIVVCCSAWHCGRKDKDPLEAVRFVEKSDLGKPDIPVASKPNEIKADTDFYYKCQKTCIRVLCRDSSKKKQDLLKHIFKHWEMNRPQEEMNRQQERCDPATEAAGGFGVLNDDANEVSNLSSANCPVQLTQDSDTEDAFMSPDRSVMSYSNLTSPIPVPRAHLFQSPP